MNIKVVLEYDGTRFSGFQQQARGRTVEGELKRSLMELTGESVKVYGAGRTDAGAHARGQVVSFRLSSTRIAVSRLIGALNARLPEDVAAVSAEVVPDEFHARYSAVGRRYQYRYLDRVARSALDRHRCWQLPALLSEGAMAQAAAALVGRHDWTSFCSAAEPPVNRVRTMRAAAVWREEEMVLLELEAEGFLRGLVRGIAGALAQVGTGSREPAWLGELLAARDRSLAARNLVRTAPARGLTLMEVIYTENEVEESS